MESSNEFVYRMLIDHCAANVKKVQNESKTIFNKLYSTVIEHTFNNNNSKNLSFSPESVREGRCGNSRPLRS